jgi:hypothetical protein
MPAVWKSTHAPRVGIPAEPVSVRNRKRDIRLFRLILLGESDRADKSSQTQEVGPWSHVDLCDRARRPPVRASHPGAPDVSVASEHSGRRLDVDGDAAPHRRSSIDGDHLAGDTVDETALRPCVPGTKPLGPAGGRAPNLIGVARQSLRRNCRSRSLLEVVDDRRGERNA